MASTLKHLRSSTADKRPTASGLVDGQFAINTASGTPAVFFKDNNGGVVKVGPAHVGPAAPNAVPAGSAGNSLGELWVDNSLTTPGLNYYTGSAFVNLTPSGTTTTVGLVELATPAETQTGTDAVRAVTPSGLQSKVSDSTSTTSSTTIASSTAVKSAYDLANAALPKAGGTVTGELLIGNTGSLVFEGSSDDSFETTIAVVDPTGDRTITFPNVTGTVVTTGDSGTVTSTMIANDTIVNADINSAAAIAYSKLALSSGIVNTDISASAAIAHSKLASLTSANILLGNASNVATSTAVTGDVTISNAGVTAIASGAIVDADISASAEIAVSKLADGAARQLLQTDAAGTGVEWASNIDIPGTLDVTSAATFDSTIGASAGTASLPSITFTGDLNTGIYSPGADQVAVTTGGTGRLFIDGSGNIGIGTVAAAGTPINIVSSTGPAIGLGASNGSYLGTVYGTTYSADEHFFITPTGGYHYYKALVTGPNAVPENVFNDDGANLDFRVEGDTNANLFFVDASTDRVGINDSTPDALLTVNGVASFGAGSASAPSIAARGDLNTGVYFPGADQVAISTNGTGRLFVDASGNVGIGTTPTVRLHVSATDGTIYQQATRGTGTTWRLQTSGVNGQAYELYDITNSQRAYLYTGGTGGSWQFSTEGTERLRITSAGLVGIGTSAPNSLLEIAASSPTLTIRDTATSVTTASPKLRLAESGAGTAVDQYWDIAADNTGSDFSFQIKRQTSTYFHIAGTTGRVGVGTTSPGANLELGSAASANQSLKINSAGNNYLELSTTGATGEHKITAGNSASGTAQLIFETASGGVESERARIDSSGRLGIGTSAPGAAIDVRGGANGTSNEEVCVFARPDGLIRSSFRKGVSTGAGFSYGTTTNHPLALRTGDAERLYITQAGLVGIGSTTPSKVLTIANADPVLRFEDTDGGAVNLDANASSFVIDADPTNATGSTTIQFKTDGAERARIDSSGRLLVGTSTARANFFNSTFSARLQVEGATSSDAVAAITRSSVDSAGPILHLAKSRSAVGGNGLVSSSDQIGVISFQGSDGTEFVPAAYIEAYVDGTPGANDMPGRLVFSTTADGASSPTERMRIDSAGAIHHAAAGGGLITTFYSGSVTDNGASGVATFAVTFTFPDSANYFICEIIGYHPSYTGANEYYRVLATKRTINNTFEASLLEDLSTTGSVAVTDTTVTVTGRRPRSNTGTAINSSIQVIFRGTVLPTSVTIADS